MSSLIIFIGILGQRVFNEVFGITKNVQVLEGTLNQGNRWYKLGEQIFARSTGFEDFRQISKRVTIVQTIELFNKMETRHPNVTWGDFKRIGIENYKIHSLKNFPGEGDSFDDTTLIKDLFTTDKEKIAGAMLVNGWEHFVDYYIEDVDDRKQWKTSISNTWQSTKTPTQNLVDLIIQYFTEYNMENFFHACKACGYNDTLKNLVDILKPGSRGAACAF